MSTRTSGEGCLAGITILDFSAALTGPHTTFLLAAMGANVIKIEDPRTGARERSNPPFVGPEGLSITRKTPDYMSTAMMNRGRGKRGITLNLKHAESRNVFRDLVSRSDVVFENFTAGTADRIGIGYAAASAIRPDIVYCSLNGFGQQATGLKAMDSVIQGYSGSAMSGGYPGGPPQPVGYALADTVTPLFAVIGIVSALLRRSRTGRGEYVDVSMNGAITSLVATEDWEIWRRMGVETRNGMRLPRLAPFGMFKCKDGYVTLSGGDDRNAAQIFELIGRPELGADPNFKTVDARLPRDQEIADMIEAWAAAYTREEVIEALRKRGVPAGPVRTPLESVNDPDIVAARDTIPVIHPDLGQLEGLRTAGLAVHFREAAVSYERPAPKLGQHNDEVYGQWLGYSADRIAALRRAGAI